MRKLVLVALLAAATLSLGAVPIRAQASLQRDQALSIVRGVMTVEVDDFFAQGKGFGDLVEVVSASQRDPGAWTQRAGLPLKILDSSTATVLDYTIRLTRSDDKKHVQVSLTPTVSKGCEALSWFIDDRLLIYTGKPLC